MPDSVEIRPVIEIRDPTLAGESIAQQIHQKVAQRRRAGAYDFDREAFDLPLVVPGQADRVPDLLSSFPGLRDNLQALMSEGHLREPAFTSSVPVLGNLIVWGRRLWNWMSTKWYVRPILQQQSDQNARATLIVSTLAQWHALDAQRICELEARVSELEARFSNLAHSEEGTEA